MRHQSHSLLTLLYRPPVASNPSAIVSGGSQDGTYTFRVVGTYNLVGHPDSAVNFALTINVTQWIITNGAGVTLYNSSDKPAFPWLADWSETGGVTVTQG